MIRRIVLVKLKDEYRDPARQREVAEHSRGRLLEVPGVRDVRVGIAAEDKTQASWDVCLDVGFDRLEDVEPYVVHPVHRAYVDEYLSPKATFKKAWNFEAL